MPQLCLDVKFQHDAQTIGEAFGLTPEQGLRVEKFVNDLIDEMLTTDMPLSQAVEIILNKRWSGPEKLFGLIALAMKLGEIIGMHKARAMVVPVFLVPWRGNED